MENLIIEIEDLITKIQNNNDITEFLLGKLNELRLAAASVDLTSLEGLAEYLEVRSSIFKIMNEIDTLILEGQQMTSKLESLASRYQAFMN